MDYYIIHPGEKEANYKQTLVLDNTKRGLGSVIFLPLDKVERMVFSEASCILASCKIPFGMLL